MSPLIPSEKKSKFNLNKIKNSLRSLPAWLVVGPFCLSALLAILWALTVSLRTNQDFFTRGAFAIQIPPYIKNYFLAWTQMRVGRYFLNSV